MIYFHKTLDRHEGKGAYKIEKRQKKKKESKPLPLNQKIYSELGIGAQLNFSA